MIAAQPHGGGEECCGKHQAHRQTRTAQVPNRRDLLSSGRSGRYPALSEHPCRCGSGGKQHVEQMRVEDGPLEETKRGPRLGDSSHVVR
jgi:hypothetical protein